MAFFGDLGVAPRVLTTRKLLSSPPSRALPYSLRLILPTAGASNPVGGRGISIVGILVGSDYLVSRFIPYGVPDHERAVAPANPDV